MTPSAVAAGALGAKLLWLAAVYQFFTGLKLEFGLAAARRRRCVVPAATGMPVSPCSYVPLARS